MSPPTPTYSLSSLSTQINTLPNGKSRNPTISLTDCPLKELVQYKCNIHVAKQNRSRPDILCEPVVRMFRMCAGGLSIETTAWEGWRAGNEGNGNDGI